ncbi:MAG: nickel pincer cofactor biosynthesis protein LarC [Candidatus Hydrothermarchaeales archaeon]
MKIAHIDPSLSGISGNMVLGALLDLRSDVGELKRVAAAISKDVGCKIRIEKGIKKGTLPALWVDAKVSGGKPFDLVGSTERIAKNIKLGSSALDFALRVADTLVEAEKVAHRSKEVDLHELGSPDTLLDIIGVACLGDALGLFEMNVYSASVNTGKGAVETSHGKLLVPAPVTAEILRKFEIPFHMSGEGELATPTGIAILANLATFSELPPAKITAVGVGAGTKDIGMPNVLRILLCETGLPTEAVSVLETSIDDVSGEVLGYTLEKLYAEGALDVQIIPTTTKKHRPGNLVKVVCRVGNEEALAKLLVSETGTLGVRISPAQKRFHVAREVKTIEVKLAGYKEKARVKVAMDGKRVINVKAEYEDAKRIAEKTGIPLKKMMCEIEKQAEITLNL